MKSLKIIRLLAALTVFFASFQIAFAQQQQQQEKVKLEVFDAFGELNCDSLLGRIDSFFYAIKNNPGATGYVIIQGNDKTHFLRHEWWIYSNVESRRFDDSRLVVVRIGGEGELPFTQFWLVPPGAEKPAYVEIQPDFKIPENGKPFIFNSTAWADGPCPDGLQLKLYSDYLKANPDIRGHVVIFKASDAEFRKEKTGILTKLAGRYKIAPNQLRFFFVKETDYSYTELWLVPPRRGGRRR